MKDNKENNSQNKVARNKLARLKEIERSLITSFRSKLWSKFVQAVNEFKLIEEGDKVAVCVSGGKDSAVLAKLMQELFRHGNRNFELKCIVIDAGYSQGNRKKLEAMLSDLGIEAHIFDSDIFAVVEKAGGSPCYLCARMRRGNLYAKAKELGCNKIALGHHFDDVIETILMNVLFSGQVKTMMPKLHSQNFEDMQLIRPLYKVREKDIISWADSFDLNFLESACPVFDDACKSDSSKRMMTKKLIEQLSKIDKSIEGNIFKSVYNVSLRNVIAYKKDEKSTHFLDEYESYKT